ncbi:hypothetical protein ARC20_17140 [Stenotrophomonas panacihumi]|uniref:DUF202 domain-containing protein n=1 Tax=Stenotrophomonas panacihumi TaxID=676599 RepID=A0A0R0AVG1_9GAMM|nr:DUF202 domain-containing protein [Stenotrophomonas panacihumi]KRG48973.1 hypothetical protein ARC20_17140 [Stenotrophomonas panacihumi]PTN53800.1 DUF202 domain-containing protein [Stenotrophomonas panacihumi]
MSPSPTPDPRADQPPVRPSKFTETDPPPLPQVDESNADAASVTYSHYRTGLSNHRTKLSEHRTSLSEYRTDLSGERTEMSMRRTGLSFQRTRMSADRTLMSIIRTALSLIGFGFTIYQVFSKMISHALHVGFGGDAPRNFGLALVMLGVVLLTLGIIYHIRYMAALRAERDAMARDGLVHAESPYPLSLSLVTAILLWGIGLVAITSMVFDLTLPG